MDGAVPGWVDALSGGVPGAVAAYDFVSKLLWMHGNQSGGISPDWTGHCDANGLFPSGKTSFIKGAPIQIGAPGTILVKMSGATDTVDGVALQLGGIANYLYASAAAALTYVAGADNLVASLGSDTLSGSVKAALGFDNNGRSLVANNGVVASNGVTGSYSAASLFMFCIIGSNPIGGHIQSLVLWPSRLPDATLKTISTP